jgi:AcrR family transcriptional regulator
MARPALSEEERSSRRAALLDAAQRLFRNRRKLPTVLDIARAAGMAKGAVYLWFRTKEEIFVALLDANFGKLLCRLLTVIESLDPLPALAAGSFAAKYVKVIDEMPDILPLTTMPGSVFRENLPIESLSHFNRNLGAGLSTAGELLEKRVGNLLPGQGTDLLFRTWTLTVGIWQVLDLPEALRKILDAPALSILHREFLTELEIAVTQLWRGAMNCGRT